MKNTHTLTVYEYGDFFPNDTDNEIQVTVSFDEATLKYLADKMRLVKEDSNIEFINLYTPKGLYIDFFTEDYETEKKEDFELDCEDLAIRVNSQGIFIRGAGNGFTFDTEYFSV